VVDAAEQRRQWNRPARVRALGTGAVAAALLCVAIALAIHALGQTGRERAGWLGAAGTVLMLALIAAAFCIVFVRRLGPPRARHLELEVPRAELARGDDVAAVLRVLDPAKVRGTLDVALECTARYSYTYRDPDGQRHTGHRDHLFYADASPAAADGGPQSFSFTVPPDGGFSYDGKALWVAWAVVARETADRRVDRGRDVPITVLP